jgi:hypothetical protein
MKDVTLHVIPTPVMVHDTDGRIIRVVTYGE